MKYRLLTLVVAVIALSGGLLWWGHYHPRQPALPKATSQTSNPARPESDFNKHQYPLDQPSSLWVVVNKKRPLNPIDYAPTDLTDVGNGQQLRLAAANALATMFADAKAAGFSLVAESGYRSYLTQANVYSHEVQAFGQAKADTESARGGYSEHQTGWAVDIGATGCYEDCFGITAAATWVKANAYRYGFLLRYPVDKAAITGYRNEPWHFRYLGPALTTELHSQQVLTLEEFFGLPAAPNY